MYCKRCNSLMINSYEDVFCPMCGYRDIIVSKNLLLTVETSRGTFMDYDLEKNVDLIKVSKWLKRCVGSQKVGKFLREKSITCNTCWKYLPPTPNGRTPVHLPSVWFAEKILTLINLATEYKKGLKNVE